MMIFVQFYFLPYISGQLNNQPIIDNYDNYTAKEIYQIVVAYGEKGRAAYNLLQIIDIIFPLLSGTFFSMLLSKFISILFKTRNKLWYIGFYPFLLTVFDYLENIGVFMLLRTYEHPISAIGTYTLIIHNVKLFFYMTSMAMIMLCIVILLLGKIIRFTKKS